MTLKCHIPRNIGSMLDGIPAGERPEDEGDFWEAVAEEFLQLIENASRARQPEIVFWEGMKTADQRIWEFYVNDLAQPLRDQYNFHGQNTSQWLYAGAIVLQDRKISRHH